MCNRRASEESILAIQIFDQKKFKKKDQGFLGVINVRIGSVMDMDVGGDGDCLLCSYRMPTGTDINLLRNAYSGPQEIKRQSDRAWKAYRQSVYKSRSACQSAEHLWTSRVIHIGWRWKCNVRKQRCTPAVSCGL